MMMMMNDDDDDERGVTKFVAGSMGKGGHCLLVVARYKDQFFLTLAYLFYSCVFFFHHLN